MEAGFSWDHRSASVRRAEIEVNPTARVTVTLTRIPTNTLRRLTQYIKETHSTNRVSVERVASGTGLVNVYNFLSTTFPERIDQSVHDGEGKMR